MKNRPGIWGVVICFAIGLGIVGFAVHSITAPPAKEVKCGGSVMHPGDRCKETSNGSTSFKSYSDMRKKQDSKVGAIIGCVVGAGFILYALVLLLGFVRSRRRSQPPPPPLGTAGGLPY